MVSCEFCEIFKNAFLTEHLWTTASVTGIYFICGMLNTNQLLLLKEVYYV